MYSVFIADDEVWVVIGLKKLIEKSGLPFKVIGEANNGVTALEEMEKNPPDVFFSDIRMPGYTGLEVLEELSKRKIQTRTVFISGYAEFSYAQKAVELKAYDYLLKPIEQEQLNKVLERLAAELAEKDLESNSLQEEEISLNIISQIVNEIQEHFTENITLTDLAEKYGISTSHLSGLLKNELKLSFSEYITARRMQKAKELLKDEKLSIAQVAELTGYNDYFYFTKVFKKSAGISPSKYRKDL
ncbi:MAG: response regulator [Lachnospiraceae bacterium]|nr:response regulator [Lachnospiraceae bacterium]